MSTSTLPTLSTENMAEVLYLLDRGFHIADVGMQTTMEGSGVFSVTLEGDGIASHHSEYLCYCPCQMSRLALAFEAVKKAIRVKHKALLEGGAA